MCPINLIFFFFFLPHLIVIIAADDIAVNCGSSGTSIALDGRQWVGDIGSRSAFSRQPNGKPVRSKALAPQSLLADPIPYMTACISNSKFAYTFRVSAGQKFIRLHFYPASFPGFERSKAFFTVKAGPYTLLSNFSASLTADALGLKSFAKEFCVNFEENQEVRISFSPSSTRASDGVYAFVNGIEIISMPSGLYYTPDGEPGAQIVGHKHRFPIDNSTALELVERLNVGGSPILSVEDWAMFRRWSGDSNYLLQPSGLLLTATSIPVRVKYTKIPTYSAPQKVYQTAWSMDPNNHANKMCNLTWKLPVDLGFRYLVRLHFCELDFMAKESGQREFVIFINNKIVEARADEDGVAVYNDYMVKMEGNRMEGKSYLLIVLQSQHHTVAVLNGIEVFKLSNPDNILAGHNPETLAHASTSTAPKLQNLLLAFRNWNAIVSCLIILITLLNIIVYRLRLWAENMGQIDISILSKSEELCRHFSLAEIQVATNNFDDALIVGEGGFGKVYKGVINKGATVVAVKRLRSMSKQGAEEFWTEVKMLSNLRHTHLVTLIGYCNDGEEMILVYEYMVNGTLADHLHKISRNDNGSIPLLSWQQRLNICIGAAIGLEYLHTGAQHRVIHRDVKTSNILLDENWVAKISDFGLSKMGGTSTINQSSTCIVTEVKGTFGYLDVEYFLTQRLTRKSDVYAFGVVLFEVLSGRPAVDKRFEGEERSLALWAQRCIKEKKLDQIVDPTIKGQISPHCLKIFMEIAYKCLHNRQERPTMSHAVQRLEFALISQGHSAYSSTDTNEEEEEKLIDVSMNVNLPTNEKEVEKVINEITSSMDAQQLSSFHTPMQDTTNRPKVRANKKMFSIQSAFKGMNLWRRKKNDNNLSCSGLIIEAKISPNEAKTSQVLSGRTYLAEFPPKPSCRIFSYSEIKEATKNFHRDLIIRHGGPDHSEMYRGYFDDGELQLTIERCTRESYCNFLQEVELRSRLHHQHMISFIGYYRDSDFGETILVYEYMAKGSLGDYLHGTCIDTLPWKKRLEICLGSAQALQYLHTSSEKPIIHGELTSNSILLDEKWVAKVSGLKESELDPTNSGQTRTVVTTVIRKTLGYVDPEYLLSGRRTTKSDVYSFGVVLLEVLCARESQCPDQVKQKRNLVEWFKICVQRKKIQEVIDRYLIGRIAPRSLKEYVRIADKCLLFRGVERPSMGEVVLRLQLALKQQEKAGEFIKFGASGDPTETSIAAAIRAYNKVL